MADEQEKYVFDLKQGDTKRFFVSKKDANFLDSTAKFQLRKTPESAAVMSLTHTDGLVLTTTGDEETGFTGHVAVTITDERSAAIPPGIYHGDLFVTSPAGEGIHLLEVQCNTKARFTQ